MKSVESLLGENVGTAIYCESDQVYCHIYDEFKDRIRVGMFLLIKSSFQQKNIAILAQVVSIQKFEDIYQLRRAKESLATLKPRELYKLVIIGIFVDNQFLRIIVQPNLGDKVYTIKDSAEIMNISKHKNEIYINFGKLYGYKNILIPLKLKEFFNHCAITGVTGSGKSYTIKQLIMKFSQVRINNTKIAIPIVVVDAHGDYYDLYDAFRKGKIKHNFGDVIRLVFRNSKAWFDDPRSLSILIDFNSLNPQDMAIMASDLANLRRENLETFLAVQDFFRIFYQNYKNVNYYLEDKNRFDTVIENISKQLKNSNYSKIAINIMQRVVRQFGDIVRQNYLVASKPGSRQIVINRNFIEEIIRKKKFVIFDFSINGALHASSLAKRIIISCFLAFLFEVFVNYKITKQNGNLIFILEDAHDYIPNVKRYKIIANLLREKMKLIAKSKGLGVGFILVTHTLSYVDPTIIEHVGSLIIHKVSIEDLIFLRNLIKTIPKDLASQLLQLEKGTAMILGRIVFISAPVLVSISNT